MSFCSTLSASSRGIHVELSLQHAVGGFGVLVGKVGLEVVFHLVAGVELICSSQVAAFHLVEYSLHVDESAAAEVEVDACAEHLLGKHWYVEMVGVEAGKVAALELRGQLVGNLFEVWRILDVLVGDARELFHFLRNHSVLDYVEPRCFEVEDYQRTFDV